MNILNTLTLRHLRLNRKRSLTTIIGVIIATAMITAVPTLVLSFTEMMRHSAMAETGNWHVVYQNVPVQAVPDVRNDENTSTLILNQDIGYAFLEGSKNEHKPYLFITAYQTAGFGTYNLKLIEGRFPENSSEAVISAHIADNGGVRYRIGDVLRLQVGDRFLLENDTPRLLEQDSSFYPPQEDSRGETLELKTAREYTITGIIQRPELEPYWAPGYTIVTHLDEMDLAPTDAVNLVVTWKTINKQANEHANRLAAGLGIRDEDVRYNNNLLRYYSIIGEEILQTLYILAFIVTVLIMVGSVALIYNSFAISLVERSRQFGMLASVGATRQQKRGSVFFEGLVIGALGIPAGVLFGTLGMGLTFHFVQPLIDGFINTGAQLKLVISPLTVLVSVIVSVVTILISSYIPARRAARIAPIDAIRQTQDIRLTARSIRTSSLTRRIFGFEAELGLKNLKRNNRRYKVTVFSLVISIVLFLSVSSLALLSRNSASAITSQVPYDLSVFVDSYATAQEKVDFYTAVAGLEYVDRFMIERTLNAMAVIAPEMISEEVKALQTPETGVGYRTYFNILAIDDAALARYAQENGIDPNNLRDPDNPRGILINVEMPNPDDPSRQVKHFNFQAGDPLDMTSISGDETRDSHFTIEIAALAEKTPLGYVDSLNPISASMIVSEQVFAGLLAGLPENYESTDVRMYIFSSNPDGLIEKIEGHKKQTSIGSVRFYNPAESQKAFRQMETFVFVFFYGFVVLITAICVANIINTIVTGIALRRREFAMLRSVGMTPRGFVRMVNFESIFYGIKALLYGLPISFGVMLLLYLVMKDAFNIPFAIPWGSVLVAVAAVFAMVGLTMLYASSRIRSENIIDALKEENI